MTRTTETTLCTWSRSKARLFFLLFVECSQHQTLTTCHQCPMLSQWEIPLHHHVERLRWAVPRTLWHCIALYRTVVLRLGSVQASWTQHRHWGAKVHVVIEDPEPVAALVKGCPYWWLDVKLRDTFRLRTLSQTNTCVGKLLDRFNYRTCGTMQEEENIIL